MKVSALLVSHDGARWLPTVLAGLAASTRPPDRVVAVDTGSQDASVDLVREGLGQSPLSLPPTTPWAEAVRAGLAALPDADPDDPDEWVWLLHDDATPAPTCLVDLVDAATEHVGEAVAVLGPKLCEWPAERRLLEVGVTISGSGRRETGLEPGEYDQGQHDRIHPVLAVNTAGMLVRREVLEEVGFEDRLPVMGNDLDFGWRAAQQGHGTVVVPHAVMYHVEAAHRGRRDATLVGRPRAAERAAAITTLLVNGPAALVPLRLVRLLLGGLLRALGFLLVRSVREARGEIDGLAAVYLHPSRIVEMRRERRGTLVVPRREVRPLLAPWWLPYRHGLDFVSDLTSALLEVGREAVARPDEDGRSLGRRVLVAPATWAALLLTVLALVANRGLVGGGPLHGGALLRAPDGVGHWWGLWAHGWHALATGTDAPAPPYVLPMALAGTLLLGSTGVLVSLLFVLVAPLAMLSAHRFTRRVMPGRWAAVWAAVAYALVPVVGGAVQQGRLGTVVAALVLPFVATSALGLAAEDADRRERAVWRTALGAGVLVAFVPVAFLLVVLLLPAAEYLTGRRPDWRRLVALVWAPLLISLPYLVGTLGQPGAWLVEAGRASALQLDPSTLDLLLGRSGGPGSAPAWMAVGLPLAALVALVRADTRRQVARAWVVTAAAAVLLLAVSWAQVQLPGTAGPLRPWPGFLVLVLQAGFVVAAGVAAAGSVRTASETGFAWRRIVGGVALVGAVAAPVLAGAWWVTTGTTGPLTTAPPVRLPVYMTQASAATDDSAVLVLRGGAGGRDVRYRVLRTGTLRLGDDGVLALTPEDTDLTSSLGELLAGSEKDVAPRLAADGISLRLRPRPREPGCLRGDGRGRRSDRCERADQGWPGLARRGSVEVRRGPRDPPARRRRAGAGPRDPGGRRARAAQQEASMTAPTPPTPGPPSASGSPSGGSSGTSPGISSGGSRTPLLVALLAVLVTVAALGLAGRAGLPAPATVNAAGAPTEVDRTVACPGGLPSATLETGTPGQGSISSRPLPESSPRPRTLVTPAEAARAAAATQVATSPRWLATTPCVEPRSDWWFVGAGGSGPHASSVLVANPRSGGAVVDIDVYGPKGIVEAPGLRGVIVPPRSTTALELSQVAPATGDLAVHVTTSQGLVSVSTTDALVPGTIGRPLREWVSPQPAAAKDLTLTGLPSKPSTATLLVANPGEVDALVRVEVVGAKGSFSPRSGATVQVPPGTVRPLPLTAVFDGRPLAVHLESDHPVAATVRSIGAGDEAYAGAADVPAEGAVLGVPSGVTGEVRVSSRTAAGSLTVTSYGEKGGRLGTTTVKVPAGATAGTALPRGTRSVVLGSPSPGVVAAGLVLTGRTGIGSAVFASPVESVKVPQVRPGG